MVNYQDLIDGYAKKIGGLADARTWTYIYLSLTKGWGDPEIVQGAGTIVDSTSSSTTFEKRIYLAWLNNTTYGQMSTYTKLMDSGGVLNGMILDSFDNGNSWDGYYYYVHYYVRIGDSIT